MPSLDLSPQEIVSRFRIRLCTRFPFLGTLALLMRIEPGIYTPTIATNGRDVLCNPDYLVSLPAAEVDSALLHAVLHAALLHLPRRGDRDPVLWNSAADIVVDDIVVDLAEWITGGAPFGHRCTVEEEYERLAGCKQVPDLPYKQRDLRDTPHMTPDTLVSDWHERWRTARAFHKENPRVLLPEVMRTEVEQVIEELNRCVPSPREDMTLDIEAVRSGRGESVSFPETPTARFAATITLARATPEIETIQHSFRWMVEHTSPEWVQLFALEVFRKVRAAGKMGLLASLLNHDPRMQRFMEYHARLMDGKKA